MTRFFQSGVGGASTKRNRWFRLTAILCGLLVVFAATLQVAHDHPLSKQAEHCQICIAIHSALPAGAASAHVTFTTATQAAPVTIAAAPVRFWDCTLFNRPPPFSSLLA